MTPQQTQILLAYIVSLDTRWAAPDKEMLRLRVHSWSTLLEEVPPDFARGVVDRYYAQEHAYKISPDFIRTAWQEVLRRQDAEQTRRQMNEVASTLFRSAPDWVRPYYEACRDAAANGDPMPDPPVVTELDQTDPERRCGEPRCGCPHTHCRAGWLDGPSNWDRAERCPLCWEATDMRETLAADERPRRRWGAR